MMPDVSSLELSDRIEALHRLDEPSQDNWDGCDLREDDSEDDEFLAEKRSPNVLNP